MFGEEAGNVHLALDGYLDGNLAVIAIQNVFDRDESYLIDCKKKDHKLNGSTFCDELVVLPPGVYEVRVQSPDPDCESEKDHYKALVEPKKTTEIKVKLVCGEDNGALDTIVKEDHRPTIKDIKFWFEYTYEPANKFICKDDTNVVIAAVLSDEDTRCEDLEVEWQSRNPYLSIGHFMPPYKVEGKCIATATVDAYYSYVGDYWLTIHVRDDGAYDQHTSKLSIPIHIIDCDDYPAPY
ncbi:hypothetical protein [Vulgatibacter sp.]|uniref:hypothetical protein n=1 Tax=Vulgatibacter sp. TaxID=1971226 RepID=UPI0035649C55